MGFTTFLKELGGDRVEGELIPTVFFSLLASFALFGLLYFVRLRFVENFTEQYGFFLVFAIITFALLMPTIRQVRAYNDWLCMPGMMIGMTSGMIAGFLPGFFVAATNGMFVGSVFGMAVGIVLGVWNGKCCGVMGVMEGMMAGFMGGLMGAMTAFMLYNDHLRASTVVVFLVSAVILILLNYMIFTETKEHTRARKESYALAVVVSCVLTVITTWLIVFGPRSGVFG